MTLLLLLAACDRSPSPDDESVETSNHASEPDMEGEVVQVSRSGRPIVLRRYFYDADGDEFGVPGSGLWASRRPVGYTRLAGDCDDTDATVNPAEVEVEADGVDNNCDGTTDESADTGTDTGADTGSGDSGTDTADSGSATDTGVTSDTAASDDTATSDTAVTSTGILVSRDTTDGLTYPATIYAWYGSSTMAFLEVSSASYTLNFAPTDAELSDHSWVDIQAAWSSGASWSDDCDGFSVSSTDYTVALYENSASTSTSDTCRIYVGLAVPSGGDAGVWTAVP